MEPGQWTRWQDAITCYNQANTDNITVPDRVDWILLCGAFEKILDASSKAKDVAAKFSSTLNPSKRISGKCSRRHIQGRKSSEEYLSYAWMSEFYRVRNDYAHGKQETNKNHAWHEQEHILIAAFVFPLIVRRLLSSGVNYTLSPDDQAHIDAFESMLDDPRKQWEDILQQAREDERRATGIQLLKEIYEERSAGQAPN